jgi:hypothetical protein
MGDIVAVDVDRHDLPAVLLARAFRRRGSQHEHGERIEEAEIGAFELSAERAEAGGAAGAEPAPLRARAWPYANDLESWRIPRKIKI